MKIKSERLVFGVGINDAEYVTRKFEKIEVNGKIKQKLVWICPYYRTWNNMLQRCSSDKLQERRPTYAGCSVSEEWKRFSNFRKWMMSQDWEGKHLDKDLLFESNKVYGAGTCVFVTSVVNSFTTDRGNDRGEWMIGVYLDKGTGKFRSLCCNPFTNKQENLGLFKCELEAHKTWLRRKLELAHELATIQADPRVAKALIEQYSDYVI